MKDGPASENLILVRVTRCRQTGHNSTQTITEEAQVLLDDFDLRVGATTETRRIGEASRWMLGLSCCAPEICR